MKQESNKKSKLWLWLVIALAALLAVAGIVLALLLPGQQNGDTDAVEAELYWNIDGAYYLEISEVPGFSAREAAEDGNYYITFAYQGQKVELQIVDKQLVNYIDTMTVVGLVFDANGIVVDAVSPETVATETAKDFYVQKVDGNTVILNSSRALNGMDMELTLTEAAGIYDVTDKAEFPGAVGQLEIMDRVQVYSDLADENVTHVYILEHPVDAGIYWRVERLYDTEAKVTTRVPDENGVYTMEFAHEGEIVELKCKDAQLVSNIDSQAILSGQFAFLFDEDGYIVETADIAMALRGKLLANYYHITAIEGDTYTATRIVSGAEQGRTVTFKLAQDCDVFQVCQFGCYDHNCGERTDELKLYDAVNIYGNVDGEAILIFVTRRIAEDEFYYNYNRQYGGVEKGTNRTKQSDGYYHFELLLDGKVKTVRAKKEQADQMDAISSGCMGLKLNGNVVERVYDAGCVTGGSELGGVVTMRSGPILTLTSAYSGNSWNVMMSADCKVYNAMTGEYGKTVGGMDDVMLGDNVMTFRDYATDACYIFIRSRAVEGAKVYYNLSRMWSDEKQETTRVPNEEGYYEFLMACEGKQVTVKTKSKGMASFIDQQLAPLVGLKVNKSGVATNAYVVDSVIPNSAKACNYRYVENVTKSTFNTYYFPGLDMNKKTVDASTWNIAKDCKVYNVSTAYSQFRGEKATLKNGDYIQAIRNYTTNEITHIFIMQRDPTYGVKSYKADCAHCGKNVTWQPYSGKDNPVQEGHYFMCVDLKTSQCSIGKRDDDKVFDIVLDLKGYTLSSTTRTFLIYDSLTVMDTKGGGKLVGTTPTSDGTGTSGSCIMLGQGGKLNIMGGELTVSDKSTAFGEYGGVLYIGTDAQVTMSGGKICGGTANTMGGNVAVLGGSFTMTGGVIENGTSPNGAAIRVNSGSFTMTGGTVDGSITKSANATVELSGKPVIKGAGLTVAAGTKLDLSKLSKDASVAVSATGIFTDVLEDPESWLNIIKPGAEGDKIIVKNNALCYIQGGPPSFVLDQDGDGMAVCPVCGGEEVAWTAVTAGERIGSGVSGHYYIKENVTSAHNQFATTTAKEHTLCIHLNGKTLTTSGRIATVGNGGTINIMGDGTLVGSGTANGGTDVYTDATLVPNSNGSINLYDNVTVTTTAVGKPVVKVFNNANIKLYGNATVKEMTGGEGILIEKGKLTVNEGWNGSALVKFPTALTDGVVSKSNGVSIGAFTGTLTLNAEGMPKLVALKGGLALEGVSGGPVEFVLDPDGDGKAVCPACGENVYWERVAGGDRVGAAKTGHYYLAEDSTDPTNQYATTTAKEHILCIHLNGKTLTTSGRIATVGSGGTINIMGKGTITGSGAYTGKDQDAYTLATLVANSGGSINLYEDVTVTTTATGKPVVVALNNGKINLYGNATVKEMTGGEGIDIQKGVLTVAAGWNGSALVKFPAALVNGVVPAANGVSTGDFTGTLTLNAEGKPQLIAKNGGLALKDGSGGEEEPPVQEGGFVLDPDGDGKAVCPVCGGEEVQWTAVGAGEKLGSAKTGHFYLAGDGADTSAQYATTTAKEHKLCIHLNGKNLTTSGRIATVGSGGTINIMGKGTITGSGAYTGKDQDAYTLATLVANSSGTINLYEDVTVTTTAAGKPVAVALNNGKINLYGNATVKEMSGGEGIDIQKGMLTVAAGWNGSALVKFPAALVDGVVPAANGASTGDFTGTLTLSAEGKPQLIAKDGGLAVKEGSGGEEEPPVQEPAFVLDPDGDGKAVCPVCGGEEVAWTAVEAGQRVGAGKSGHFYLAGDGADTSAQYATTTAKEHILCIHLNGKNLTTSGRIATVGSGGTINIMGKGTITGSGAYTGADQDAYTLATLVANSSGTINLYEDVTVTTTAAGKPVVVALNNGKINLYGNATVIPMAGGEGIDIQKGVLTVAAGWNGSALVKFPAALVDGVVPAANGASTGDFTGTLTLSAEGKPQLIAKDGGLAVKEGSGGEEEPANPYHKNLALDAENKALCPVCNKTVQWTAVTDTHLGSNVTDGGHYYLANDFDSTSQFLTLTGGKTVCFHLNGKNLTYPSRMFVTGSTLNILGRGTVTSTSTTADQLGALVAAYGDGVINLYGGTYKTTNPNSMPVVKVYSSITAKVNVYDGVTIESVEVHKGTLSLSGKADVAKIDVSADGKLSVAEDWTGTATVKFANEPVNGVVPAANGASTGDFTGTLTLNAAGTPQLIAKDGGLVVKDETAGKLVLDADNNGYCEACGKIVQWTDINSLSDPRIGYLNSKPSGVEAGDYVISEYYHFFLSADLDYTNEVQFAERYYNVNCLHLNGHNLSVKARLRVGLGGTMNIMGSGSITGSCNSTNADYNQSLFCLNGGAVLNLYGGTYTSTNAEAPAILLVDTKATTVNICGDVTVNGGVKAANGIVTLGLGAKVDTIDLSNIAKLNVLSDWTGTAGVKFATAYADGTEIPAANGQCGTLVEGVFTPGGSYTGNLFTKAEPPQQITGNDGKLIVNPNHSQDNVLKILGIGNSYTIDSMHLLGEIYKAESPDQQIQLGFLYYGGCALNQHVQFIRDDAANYTYYKLNNETGKWVTTANSTAADALEDEAWDIVTLQQSSANSGKPETYNADIQTIQKYVSDTLGYTPEFLWNMTWAYAEGYNNSYYVEDGKFSQAVMYKAITDTVQAKIVPDSSFSGVIPTGTAIQNARTYWPALLESDAVDQQTYAVSRPDGTHLTSLGRFIAAYTWYSAISGETVDTLALTEIPSSLRINWGVYSYTETDAAVIAEAVRNAIATPYAVTAVTAP